MKLLSIIIPCYQSQAYMEHCIKTLLTGGEDVELLIIDDGSTDKTLEIAEKFQKDFPSIVKVVHQENKGHGGALNTGIAAAEGVYLKVVDSDDWVSIEAYQEILSVIRQMVEEEQQADLLVSNFVYEKVGADKKKVIHYRRYMKEGKNFTWKECHGLPVTNYLMMHSVIYRRKIVEKTGLKLPEHTFYVDNLYAFQPLVHVKTIRYIDVNFYRYFIGRPDQSVQEEVMLKRMDQHYLVTRNMIDYMHKNINEICDRSLRTTMYTNIKLVMAIASVLSMLSKNQQGKEKINELWRYLKKLDTKMYRKIRYSFIGSFTSLPGAAGKKTTLYCYRILQRMYGFN